jgi:hypothetical protein
LIRCEIWGSPKPVGSFQLRGISENANIFRNRILALSASTDVQTLVELRMKAIADARELFALVGLDPSAIDAFRTNSRAALASPVGAR